MSIAARSQQNQRPRLLQALMDAWSQPDVRAKLAFVFAMLVIFRFVAHIPIPGVNPELLKQAFESDSSTGAFLGTLNTFSGGALRQLSVASLGVYPFITAQIIMQILTPMIPSLPTLAAVISMTAGTMFLVWLGELITEKGIGNGTSLIIFAGIVSGVPGLIPTILDSTIGIFGLVILGAIVLFAVASIVFFQEAQRRVPVQYSRTQFRGGRQYRQQGATHIPLRVLSAGMVPLIFAYSIMLFPSFLGETLATSSDGFLNKAANVMTDVFGQQNAPYYLIVFLFVVLFTYFYTLVTYTQQNLAENLQKQGGFIPGIRPGRPTHDYITRVLVRITAAGALFLGLIAVMPYLVTFVTDVRALTISGTGLLIVVGVVLDTMKQLEAQLLMRNYSGFIR